MRVIITTKAEQTQTQTETLNTERKRPHRLTLPVVISKAYQEKKAMFKDTHFFKLRGPAGKGSAQLCVRSDSQIKRMMNKRVCERHSETATERQKEEKKKETAEDRRD